MDHLPAFLLHTVALLTDLYSLYYDLLYVYIPGAEPTYGGKWKYLTVINLVSASLYSSFSSGSQGCYSYDVIYDRVSFMHAWPSLANNKLSQMI